MCYHCTTVVHFTTSVKWPICKFLHSDHPSYFVLFACPISPISERGSRVVFKVRQKLGINGYMTGLIGRRQVTFHIVKCSRCILLKFQNRPGLGFKTAIVHAKRQVTFMENI